MALKDAVGLRRGKFSESMQAVKAARVEILLRVEVNVIH
jgi:hypothetical protein